MYLNYYSLLNTPVIEYPSRKHLGTVSDIFIKENSSEIIGMAAKSNGLIYQNRLFNSEDILYAGTDYLSVHGFGKRFFAHPSEPGFLSFRALIGLDAAPYEGKEYIGKVKDGYFDMEAGSLTEVLIGKGLADDILSGRRLLKADSYKTEDGILRVENPSLIPKSRGFFPLMQIMQKNR